MTARHSTGVTEPASVLDAELVHAITLAIQKARDEPDASSTWPDWQNRVHALLASEPMQRLRAAWTAETDYTIPAGMMLVSEDSWFRRGEHDYQACEYVVRERDEARALIAKLESNLDERTEQVFTAVEQRDSLRAEVDELTAEVERLRAELERWKAQDDATAEALRGCRHFGEAYESAIGRLRAAVPDLPDVVSVKREGEYVVVDLGHNCGALSAREGAADMAAIGLAAVRVFDREAEERAAADTTTDDPRSDTVIDWAQSLINGDTATVGPLDAGELLARLDAHRARTHGEGA